MSKAIDTLSLYVIVIAFPLQQHLHEGPSLLLYAYIACLVFSLDYLYRKQLTDIGTWIFQWHICPIGYHELICGVVVRGLYIFDLGTSLLRVVKFKPL